MAATALPNGDVALLKAGTVAERKSAPGAAAAVEVVAAVVTLLLPTAAPKAGAGLGVPKIDGAAVAAAVPKIDADAAVDGWLPGQADALVADTC